MIDKEFLNGVLADEKASADEKITKILAEYDTSISGLKSKNNELILTDKSLKEQMKALEAKVTEEAAKAAEAEKKAAAIEDELKKNSPEDKIKLIENQFAAKEKAWMTEKEAIASERDKYRQSHLSRLRDELIVKSIDGLQFVDGLKDGYIARVLALGDYQPKEIDGKIEFISSDHRELGAAIKDFAATAEGKAYLKQLNSGGGAAGGLSTTTTVAKSVTRAQFEAMNPSQRMEFTRSGGTIA